MDDMFDYNEYVSSKLCEWADPLTRLEKKRIQKQHVNQNCREWLKDLVNLDQVEIEMLAEDEGEAKQIRKDHAKYARKAVFDEYTFKKKPITKDELEERQFKESARKKTMDLLEELKREQQGDCELGNTEYAGFLRRRDSSGIAESGDGSVVKGKKWFTRPWLTKRGVSTESVCKTDDRNRRILVQLQRLIKEALEEELNEKILETVRLLKAGILFDAIYVKAEEMVRTIIGNARRHVPDSDRKWLDKLEEESPEKITDNMVDEIFEEAPLSYFQNKIKKYFMEACTVPITEGLLHRGIISKDPTLVTTKFDRKEVFSMVKQELAQHRHVCTNFIVAEKIAKIIAVEVVDAARFRMDLPGPDSDSSEPERNIKALYEQRLAEIKKNAEKRGRKNLEHLRDPENPRKDVQEVTLAEDKYGNKSNCKCSKISELGGKKRPFVFPEYKKKANYYFYNKFISDGSKNFKSATLYPKTKQNIKLVCDDHWKCIPVPLERELRDIPYRFSYAPQYVVRQIQRTKSIKKSDHPLICRILEKMEQTKKVVDMAAILKKINEEKRYVKSFNVADASLPTRRELSDLKAASVTISARSEIIAESGSTNTTKTKVHKDTRDSRRLSKITSHSHSARYSTRSSATDDAHLKKAVIPKTLSRQLKVVSRESQVPKAPDPQKYHEHILQGYKYDMVPITPCRFHSLKRIKAVLKRFETAGGPAALEYHFENRQPPVSVDELLPIPRLVDTFRQWRKDEEQDSSLWTRALNDSRLKRMARFRKIHHKDPVFGFMSNWESPTFKCPIGSE